MEAKFTEGLTVVLFFFSLCSFHRSHEEGIKNALICFSLDLINFNGVVDFVHFRHDSALQGRAPLFFFSSLQGITQVNMVLRMLRYSPHCSFFSGAHDLWFIGSALAAPSGHYITSLLS